MALPAETPPSACHQNPSAHDRRPVAAPPSRDSQPALSTAHGLATQCRSVASIPTSVEAPERSPASPACSMPPLWPASRPDHPYWTRDALPLPHTSVLRGPTLA